MKKSEWFRLKSYPHIGKPLKWKDKKRVCSYIKNSEKIAIHSFYPFIHAQIRTSKFRKQYDKVGNLLNQGKRKTLSPKKRDIYYANHLDANIFSYYSFILSQKYEQVLKQKSLSQVVTAYRKVPLVADGVKRNKCNIDFANDIFNYIRHNSESNDLIAITFDIKGFFDNLNHQLLYKRWCKVLEIERLPKDHYNVFRNITKFSYVEKDNLFELFKDKILVQNKSGEIEPKPIKKIQYLHNQNAVAFCELTDIHEIRKKGLIKSNKRDEIGNLRSFGICQGSPISATLANIYMLEFDESINTEVQSCNGVYRRYSDDMIVICSLEYRQQILDLFYNSIRDIAQLEIQASKTQIFHFKKKNNQIICEQEFNGVINSNSRNKKFEYLGFSFDGQYVYLKTTALAKYYRKMKMGAKRSGFYSKTIDNNTRGQMFEKKLFKRYSFIGATRYTIYKRRSGTTNKWVKTEQYNWGNFITYAKLASSIMDNNKIDHQIKNHWKNLNKEIHKYK